MVGLVLREGMMWAGGGIAVGLIGALASARVMATLLFDVGVRDPLTISSVAAAMTIVALLACAIPAARTVRIDPTVVMRVE